MITEEAIGQLTELLIKEHFKNKDNQDKFIMTKLDLIKFTIKVMKVLKEYE